MAKKKSGRKQVVRSLKKPRKAVIPNPAHAASLQQALRYHEQQQYPQAMILYQKILIADPNHLVAMQFLGLAKHQQGDTKTAIEYMQQVLKLEPRYSVCASNLGLIYYQQKDLELARKYNQQAIKHDKENLAAYLNVAQVYIDQREFKLAENCYQHVLRREAKHAESLGGLGLIAYKQIKFAAAKDYYQQSLAINPRNADVLNNLGLLQVYQTEFAQAKNSFNQALLIDPQHAACWSNSGMLFVNSGELKLAEQCYQKAVQFKPKDAKILGRIGALLQNKNLLVEAESYYKQALAIEPQHDEASRFYAKLLAEQGKLEQAKALHLEVIKVHAYAWQHYLELGNIAYQQQDYQQAGIYYQQALDLAGDKMQVNYELATCHKDNGDYTLALKCLATCLAINPEHNSAKYLYSAMELLIGNYAAGWEAYVVRFKVNLKIQNIKNGLAQFTEWQGEALGNQTLYISWEQGFGDTIQFMRYITLIQQQHPQAQLIFCCQPALHRLFQASLPKVTVIKIDAPMPVFDQYVFVMDLPRIFQTELTNIPASVPYLFPETLVTPQLDLDPEKFKIGIVWAGNKDYMADKHRSVQLKPFLPLLEVENTQFYSLQIGENVSDLIKFKVADKIIDCSSMIKDFADTASIIQQLDLVITIDSGVAHLTGALNIPVWICNRFGSEWRWLLEREDSPWYPSARLFRQTKKADWEGVMDRIKLELEQTIAEFVNASN